MFDPPQKYYGRFPKGDPSKCAFLRPMKRQGAIRITPRPRTKDPYFVCKVVLQGGPCFPPRSWGSYDHLRLRTTSWDTPPKFNCKFSPEKWWLQGRWSVLSFWDGLFSGAFAVKLPGSNPSSSIPFLERPTQMQPNRSKLSSDQTHHRDMNHWILVGSCGSLWLIIIPI